MQVGVLFTRRNRICLAFAMAGLLVAACDSGGSIDEVTAPEIALNRNGQPKVLVCHVSSEDGTIVLIATGNPANHIGNPAHTFNAVRDYDPIAAGATGVGKKDSDGNGIADGCEIPDDETIFAIAYTNVDGQPGFDESAGDLLIAKLVDESGDGVPGSGDAIKTNSYPTDFVFSQFGAFEVPSHTLTGCDISALPQAIVCFATINSILENFKFTDGLSPAREEYRDGALTYLIDSRSTGFSDFIQADADSPSGPDTPVNTSRNSPTDDGFLEVDLLYNP